MGAPIRVPANRRRMSAANGKTHDTVHKTRVSSGGRIRTDDPGLMNPML